MTMLATAGVAKRSPLPKMAGGPVDSPSRKHPGQDADADPGGQRSPKGKGERTRLGRAAAAQRLRDDDQRARVRWLSLAGTTTPCRPILTEGVVTMTQGDRDDGGRGTGF